jgi:hypothetical protein
MAPDDAPGVVDGQQNPILDHVPVPVPALRMIHV